MNSSSEFDNRHLAYLKAEKTMAYEFCEFENFQRENYPYYERLEVDFDTDFIFLVIFRYIDDNLSFFWRKAELKKKIARVLTFD